MRRALKLCRRLERVVSDHISLRPCRAAQNPAVCKNNCQIDTVSVLTERRLGTLCSSTNCKRFPMEYELNTLILNHVRAFASAVLLAFFPAGSATSQLGSWEIPFVADFLDCVDQLEIGCAYFDKEDYASALGVFRPLADAGNAAAQNNLGVLYETGTGLQKDDAVAIMWYRRGAEQGHAVAQYNLGAILSADYLLETAQDESKRYENLVSAYMWLTLASEGGFDRAAQALKELAKHITAVQIEEAERRAQEWVPMSP